MTAVRARSRTVAGDRELRRTLVLVSAVVCFETVLFTVLGPLLPHLADRFDLSKTGAGVLVASYAAGAFFSALPSGLVATRIGAKATALVGLVVLGLASVLFGFAGSVLWLYVARILQGVGCSLAWTGGFAWLLVQTPRERRGGIVGVALSAAVGGALLGPAIGALASSIGTKSVFVGLAVPAVALAVWGAAIPAGPTQVLVPLGQLRSALAARPVLTAVLMTALAGFLIGVIGVLAPLRLSRLGWGAAGVGAVFLTNAGITTILNPSLGRWSDRRTPLVPLRVILLYAVVGSLALTVSTGRWPYAAIVLAGGVSYSLLWTPALVLLSDASDELGLGFVGGFTLMNLAWSPGHLLGSTLAGAIAQVTSDAVPFVLAAGLCLAALVSVRRMHAR